jgi:hypothetical protein
MRKLLVLTSSIPPRAVHTKEGIMRFILAVYVALFAVPALACDSNCGVRDAVAVPETPPSPQGKECDTNDCDSEPVMLFGRVLDVTKDVDNQNQEIIILDHARTRRWCSEDCKQ